MTFELDSDKASKALLTETVSNRISPFPGWTCPMAVSGGYAKRDLTFEGGDADLQRFVVDPYVHLAPEPALGATVLAGNPVALTFRSDPLAVEAQVR